MKLRDIMITEGISPIVFHSTSFQSLLAILKTDKFLTRPMTNRSEQEFVKTPKKLWFFSTARTKTGSYISTARIQLDGRKLSTRFSGTPVDYWGYDYRSINPDKFEQEDRIYTDKDHIPNATSYIIQVELSVEKMNSRTALELYKLLKRNNIPLTTYLTYRDMHTYNNRLTGDDAYAALAEKAKLDIRPVTLQNIRQDDKPYRHHVARERTFGANKGHHTLIVSAFHALRMDPETKLGMTSDIESGIFKLMRENYTNSRLTTEFHSSISDPNIRKMMSYIIKEMSRLRLKTPDELHKYLYEKWKGKI